MTRIAGLDELRGAAILLVMVGHLIGFRLPALQYWHPFSLEGEIEREPSGREGSGRFAAKVDPATSPTLGDEIVLTGWALDETSTSGAGVVRVEIDIDGGPARSAELGMPRGDAAAAFGSQHAASGWRVTWPAGGAVRGMHTLGVTVHGSTGAVEHFVQEVRLRGTAPWLLGGRWYVVFAVAAVDLFFVISGFLITKILLSAKGKPRYFRTFYQRRAARILPLALVCIAASYLIFSETRDLVWGYLLFFNNYQLKDTGRAMIMLGPMWSLAVEEQFYLLYPLLCASVRKERLWLLLGALCLFFTAVRFFGEQGICDGLYVTDGRTHIRVIAILLGGWLALVQSGLVPRPSLCAAVYVVSAALLLGAGGRMGAMDPIGIGASVALVWGAVSGRHVWRSAILRWLGVRCYGLYLLHLPGLYAVQWLEAGGAPLGPAVAFATTWVVLVVLAAAISFRFFERPLMRWASAPGRASGAPTIPEQSVAAP